jgi:hypothetical protein
MPTFVLRLAQETVLGADPPAGADRSATLHAYGGDFDVLAMLRTSAHPHDAGVAGVIERALVLTASSGLS